MVAEIQTYQSSGGYSQQIPGITCRKRPSCLSFENLQILHHQKQRQVSFSEGHYFYLTDQKSYERTTGYIHSFSISQHTLQSIGVILHSDRIKQN